MIERIGPPQRLVGEDDRPPVPIPDDMDLRRSLGFMVDPIAMFNDPMFRFPTAYAHTVFWRLVAQAWLQKPAASLPDDYHELWHLAKFGTKRQFENNAQYILKDWEPHANGRLYHPYVTEKAMNTLGLDTGKPTRTSRRQRRRIANAVAGYRGEFPDPPVRQ
jgi:hypothetical protein